MATTEHHYMLVISQGPFIVIRVPWPMPKWRAIMKALTPVMASHGLRQKDISGIEGSCRILKIAMPTTSD